MSTEENPESFENSHVLDPAATADSQETVNREIADIHASYRAAVADGAAEETQPRLDYAAVPQQPAAPPDQGACTTPTRRRSSCGRRSSAQRDVRPLESDLTIQHSGEPIGERIVVTGRVLDGDGRPVATSWSRSGRPTPAGRYIHQRDQHPAPIDPHFTGIGRCLTDADGELPLHHHQARPLPVEEPPQRLAPGAHPLLAVRHRLHPADDHPDVLPGRPAVRARPDLPVHRRPGGPRAPGRDLRPRRDPARVGHRLPLGHRADRHAPHPWNEEDH